MKDGNILGGVESPPLDLRFPAHQAHPEFPSVRLVL